jgi:putative hydrolase of the HAD superfamily
MSGTPVILFDLYGTLVLTHDHRGAWDAWHKRLLDFAVHLGGTEERATALLSGFWDGPDPTDTGNLTIFENRISWYLARMDLAAPPTDLSELAAGLCDAWQGRLEVDPEAFTMFARLDGTYRTGLVTNFDHPPHIFKLLRENALEGMFETVVVSAEEGVKKPDPEILRIACRRMACEPSRTIYLGDSIVDYEAAIAASITPVIIRRGGQEEIENSRDIQSKYRDTDIFLYKKAADGELTIIAGLNELPDAADALLGGNS